MNTKEIIGYGLFFVGLVLIVISLYQAYAVLAQKNLPPEFFKAPPIEAGQPADPLDFQRQIENSVAKALPVQLLYQSLDILLWGMILTILMLGGKHIAGLGIQLMKGERNNQ